MELLASIFFAVLFIVLAISLWANRNAEHVQRQRVAGVRLEGSFGAVLEGTPGARREPTRDTAGPWHPVLRWAGELLAQAGLDFAPETLLVSLVALALAGPALASIWLQTDTAIIAGLSLPFVPLFWLRRRRSQRLKTLAHQIPYLLDTLKAALEAGHTLLRGLQMAAQNNPEPLATELRVIVDQVRVGVNLPMALESMYRRVPIDDLGFLADAVSVQEETGSSLAQILKHVAQSIRNRQRLADQIRVLTSQSRMSAMIVAALPGVILGAFSLMRSDYTDILFHDPLGNRMLEAACIMDVLAFFIMREIARVDY
ncbi:MAG TPA: type II secretion system F family protein [Candidatus Binataceae bacterium]|nr:type II secretion system F family protein [Candidatus Binataceae bacterium]